jgi:hypothetical protein
MCKGVSGNWVVLIKLKFQAGTRFTEDELHDILEIIKGVFDEEESDIPKGVENQRMDKIPNKLLGARKGKRKVTKRNV